MKTTTLVQRGFKEMALFVIACMVVVSCMFAIATPRVHAATLTEPQIQAILNLLMAFNVPQATITNVSNILHKKTSNY
jgi:hypothetical protein